jgi:hypothetical protein
VREGSVITELNEQGQKQKGYVYAGGEVLAEQQFNEVRWKHTNPLTGSRGESYANASYQITLEAVARKLLHEIIHTATKGRNPGSRYGGYEDVELASAIFEITRDPRDDPDNPANNPPGSHPISVGGVIFQRALEKYCK